MAATRVERRLAAILAADVVGYSSLMERDEAGTLARLKDHRREFIDPLIAEHRGRTVKLMGDGALCEFASVMDAVSCAVAIQRGMAEREADLPEAERIRFRIGVNLGDVIVEGEDIYGDGVNVAARLEGLAEPGGIWVSGKVREEMRRRLELAFAPMGRQRVKNLAEPVEAWRVVLDGRASDAFQSRLRGLILPPRRRRRAVAAVLALVFVVGAIAGGWWWRSAGPTGPSLPDKPSIAVLPFENISGDPRWGRLAEGLSRDIITDLARRPDIFVIAPNSSFPYKGTAPEVRQVGQELGVRYVLEGRLEVEANRLRMTTQLVDTISGQHVWADRYDRSADDLFVVRDEITGRVAGAIASAWYGELARSRRVLARRKPPASLDAYDLYLLGWERTQEVSKEGIEAAIRYFDQAVRLDPEFARAWSGRGLAYSVAGTLGFTDDIDGAMRRFREDILHALRLDPNDWLALGQRATFRAADGDLAGTREDFERALALAPNDADNLALIAYNMPLTVGDAERMVAAAQYALRLNPSAPSWYFGALAIAQYVAGHDREAIAAAERAPVHGESLAVRAMAHARLGELEEARALARQVRTEFADFTVEGYIRTWPVTAPDALAAFREGASKAGLLPAAAGLHLRPGAGQAADAALHHTHGDASA